MRRAACAAPTAAPYGCSAWTRCATATAVRRQVGVQLQAAQLPDRMRVREALRALQLLLSGSRRLAGSCWTNWGLPTGGRSPSASSPAGRNSACRWRWRWSGNPRIAVLDELTTGLDPQARRDTWQVVRDIRDRGVTVVLVTHFMDEAERLCDRIAVMRAGQIVAVDTPAALIAAPRSRASPAPPSRTPSSPSPTLPPPEGRGSPCRTRPAHRSHDHRPRHSGPARCHRSRAAQLDGGEAVPPGAAGGVLLHRVPGVARADARLGDARLHQPVAELGGLRPIDAYLPVVLALAIGTVAMVTLLPTLVTSRERGILRRLSATPVTPVALLCRPDGGQRRAP